MGRFEFGSTIVLVFTAPKTFQFSVQPGQKLNYGEQIGNVWDGWEENVASASFVLYWRSHSQGQGMVVPCSFNVGEVRKHWRCLQRFTMLLSSALKFGRILYPYHAVAHSIMMKWMYQFSWLLKRLRWKIWLLTRVKLA